MKKTFKNNVDNFNLMEVKNIEKDTWINLINPSDDEIKKVVNELDLDVKVIKQVLVEKELPRVKKYDSFTLIVINIPYMKDKDIKNKYVTYPLGIILTKNNILTFSIVENVFLNEFENVDLSKRKEFLLNILLSSARVYLKTLESIDEDIQKREKSSYNATDNKLLINFLNIQKTLVYFITSLHANKTVLEKLQVEDTFKFNKKEAMILEDAIIEHKQCIETSTVYREILSSTVETYSSIVSNNLNVLMKFLAGITIVFSIPTMIASFLGMNVPLGELGDNPASFALIILISLIISLFIAWWLKKKNML